MLTQQLQAALDSRVVAEQPKGVLAQSHSRTPDEAFEILRGYCRSNNRRLVEAATQIATDPDSLPELTRPRPRT